MVFFKDQFLDFIILGIGGRFGSAFHGHIEFVSRELAKHFDLIPFSAEGQSRDRGASSDRDSLFELGEGTGDSFGGGRHRGAS